MATRIKMFATANDTDAWAVSVDGLFGLFGSRAEAERVYGLIGGDDDLGGTPFASCQLIPPGYRPRSVVDGTDMTKTHLSSVRAIDIEGYITKRPARVARQRPSGDSRTAQQRLADARVWASLFPGS